MLRRSAALVAVLTAAVVAVPGIAQANYSATGAGSPTVGADTLLNATNFDATCSVGSNKGPITLSWAASGSSYVASYVITKAVNGVATAPITVAAPAIGYSDPVNPNKNDVFTYTIHAVKLNWTTASLPALHAPSFTGNGGKCV